MKKIITLCTILLLSTTVIGQCLPDGLIITTQEQTLNFAADYPGCTTILGDLTISAGNFDTLEGLEQITAIEGSLNIIDTQFIYALYGLDNLATIGGDINIQNTTLQSLGGLESLTTISGGVNSIISNNSELENLNGLNNLSFWGRGIYLSANNSLSELTALSNLTSMGGNGAGIDILNNEALTSLSGIDNVSGFEIINIQGNVMLSECAVESVCNFLSIESNPAGISMNTVGCNTRVEVETICEDVENMINPVSATTTLSAQFGSSLDNTINGAGLDAFPSLSATHEMTTPGNSFLASNEPGSIDFELGGSYLVDGLTFWNQNAPGPGGTGIQEVIVSSSEDGITFTPIDGSPTIFSRVMTGTSPAETFDFTPITASYIRFDVISNYDDPGNLVAFAEVAFSGTEVLGITDNDLLDAISLYPNPTRDFINIDNTSNANLKGIAIYDMNGRLIKQVEATNSNNQRINISDLSSGVYMLHLSNDELSIVKRVIKK